MNIQRAHRSEVSKVLGAATLGVAIFALGHRASAQYSSNFNSPLYQTGATISGTDGWTSNDNYTGATYTDANNGTREIGQSDIDEPINGYSNGGTGDKLAIIGGYLNQDGGALPGVNTEYLTHSTNLPTGTTAFSFGTDFVVTATGQSFSTAHDQFGFQIGNPVNTGSGFSINFEPTGRITGTTPSTTSDNVSFTSNGTLANPVGSITLGSRYHLLITGTFTAAATGTFTARIVQENNTGGDTGTAFTVATNQAFSGSISQLSAYWKLTDTTVAASNGTNAGDVPATGNTNTTARTNGGANNLYFDNLSIAVPEPLTYAFLGAGMLGLVSMVRNRRRRNA